MNEHGGVYSIQLSTTACLYYLKEPLAENPHLRHCIRGDVAFLERLGKLLDSNFLNVRYFASGIILNIACMGVDRYVFGEQVKRMGAKILTWEIPVVEIVQYNSFESFVEPIMSEYPKVRLWAVWTIAHVRGQ